MKFINDEKRNSFCMQCLPPLSPLDAKIECLPLLRLWRSEPRTRRLISSRDGHSTVLLLPLGSRNRLVDVRRRRGARRDGTLDAVRAVELGLLGRWGHEREGLDGRYGSLANSSILREARLAHLHLAVGVVQVVALGWCPSAVSWGEETAWETWGVWSGLHLELREVEVGAGTIAGGHGLSEAALGVVAVEGYAVDDDGDDFDYYFDDAADE